MTAAAAFFYLFAGLAIASGFMVIAARNPLAEASRKADGNAHFEVVQQTSRPNHFTVVEAWKGQAAYDARIAGAPQMTFREKLGPMLGALYDERIYHGVD